MSQTVRDLDMKSNTSQHKFTGIDFIIYFVPLSRWRQINVINWVNFYEYKATAKHLKIVAVPDWRNYGISAVVFMFLCWVNDPVEPVPLHMMQIPLNTSEDDDTKDIVMKRIMISFPNLRLRLRAALRSWSNPIPRPRRSSPSASGPGRTGPARGRSSADATQPAVRGFCRDLWPLRQFNSHKQLLNRFQHISLTSIEKLTLISWNITPALCDTPDVYVSSGRLKCTLVTVMQWA